MPQAASWMGTPSIRGSTESVRMALLTFSLVGLQFTWGVELTYCTPYLLQLGLTKSRTSMVWIAGPLSGLIVQPVVGILSDSSRSRWGRRRPFMIGGVLLVAVCLLLLGWTAEIVSMFVTEPDRKPSYSVALAVFSIYAVDFAINVVQSSCRSLIVDTLPIPKQQLGSAWATRMTAIGNLVGYGVGTVDLIKVFGTTFGTTQFQQITTIAAAFFIFSVGVTSFAVKERILLSVNDEETKPGPFHMIIKLLRMIKHLPSQIQAICWVQFWSWIGWFPFLFYGATWVGETYFRSSEGASLEQSEDILGNIGRVGSLSMVIFSIVTFSGSLLLPFIIRSPDQDKRDFTPRPPRSMASFLMAVDRFKPDLITAWMIGHLIFAGAMFLTPFVRSFHTATLLISICGIPWALACWAPFAFMGVEINRLTIGRTTTLANGSTYHRLSEPPSSEPSSPNFLHLEHPGRKTNTHSSDDDDANHDPDSTFDTPATGETSGIYLGIQNVFTTLPQFVGTFISMIVFAILEPGKSSVLHKADAHDDAPGATAAADAPTRDGPNAIAVCLFIGALSSLGAAYATGRMRRGRST